LGQFQVNGQAASGIGHEPADIPESFLPSHFSHYTWADLKGAGHLWSLTQKLIQPKVEFSGFLNLQRAVRRF
jgi:hypothetical protein